MKTNLPDGATISATRLGLFVAILSFAFSAVAQATNTLSDAEIQGQQLTQKMLNRLAQPPTENATHTGVLKIRNPTGKTAEIPIKCDIVLTATNWYTDYETLPSGNSAACQALIIRHNPLSPQALSYSTGGMEDSELKQPAISGTSLPFAGSDFLVGDLSLEFLHWPEQKVVKQETHRTRNCTVLESTNPNPAANGYSRVVSWVDNESLGIVEAYAYDASGKKIKDFYPKDFKKVDGQWQVQTLVMENIQTGSRSRLEFDLKR
jgi:Outer membrane lipoprotein-sorting protein